MSKHRPDMHSPSPAKYELWTNVNYGPAGRRRPLVNQCVIQRRGRSTANSLRVISKNRSVHVQMCQCKQKRKLHSELITTLNRPFSAFAGVCCEPRRLLLGISLPFCDIRHFLSDFSSLTASQLTGPPDPHGTQRPPALLFLVIPLLSGKMLQLGLKTGNTFTPSSCLPTCM